MIDYDEVYRIAQECKPKMILAGASAYPRKIDFAKFREIADSVGAFFMVDMAHIAGLVAAGVHESPVPYADVVTTTTHKTLRGPRGGMIFCTQELAKQVDGSVFPGMQGGALQHVVAAKAIAEAEAHKGPSIIIAYSPCEMHSIKGGMENCQKEMEKAVKCGYWNLFRFNPDAEKPFTLDSKEPAGGYQEFLMNEARYSRLTREFPERADVLFQRNEDEAKSRYEHLLKLVEMYDK